MSCRLSKRSFVYTALFFISGIATCTAANTLSALQIVNEAPPYVALSGDATSQAIALLATAVLGTAAAGFAAYKTKKMVIGIAYDGFAGLVFGLGLCFSGMTRPTLVRVGKMHMLAP